MAKTIKCKDCKKDLRHIDVKNNPLITARESTGLCAKCRDLKTLLKQKIN